MLTRREFLTAAGVTALCFTALGRSRRAQAGGRWGALIPDPERILDLPAGFSYRILEHAHAPMSDGYQVPARPDGMACFTGPNGTLILMRNHENGPDAVNDGPYVDGQVAPPEAYDPNAMGGVSRLVLDATTCERISSNMVLIGTSRNCAGGPSPWGWLSCEEPMNDPTGEFPHGYVFLCPIDADSVRPPDRKPGFGRCNHEAAAVDPSTNITYLTEDRQDSCLYRFVPTVASEPFVGKLQALAVVGQPRFQTSTMAVGDMVDIEWVDIAEPDPTDDSLRNAAQAEGAAVIVRGEGICFFAGQVFFTATTGGPIGKGQIFRLIVIEGGTLELLVHSEDPAMLDMPDNLTIAPSGELVMVEDGGMVNSIRWLSAEGQLSEFGRTSRMELAGICFSPDGRAMFVNLQQEGLTLVITGPFGGESEGPAHAPQERADEASAGCACV